MKELERRFAQVAGVRLREGPQGLVFVDVDQALAEATICLQGAHLMTWRPKTQAQPVIWLSGAAVPARGKAIRGGIPVCWPWFGPAAAGSGLPSHGFVRVVDWQFEGAAVLQDGATQLRFAIRDDEATRAAWPHAFSLQLCMTIGEQLDVELATTNTGREPFLLGEALHAYFRIGDIGSVGIDGLDGAAYADSARGGQRGRQQGPIAFDGEFDRVYLGVSREVVIVDPALQRRIRVAQDGARSVVVWNPWAEKAARLGDLGAGAHGQGGWREMVCVETANALDDRVTVGPGETHRAAASYRAEPLA